MDKPYTRSIFATGKRVRYIHGQWQQIPVCEECDKDIEETDHWMILKQQGKKRSILTPQDIEHYHTECYQPEEGQKTNE